MGLVGARPFMAPRSGRRKAGGDGDGHNGVKGGRRPPSTPVFALRYFRARGRGQSPKITLFMIRPGAKVNSPVTTRARVKIQIMARRCARMSWLRARKTASGTTASVNNDRRWIGLQ